MASFGSSQKKLKAAADKAEREGNKGEAKRIRGIMNRRLNVRQQQIRDANKNPYNTYKPNGPN